MGTFVGGEPGRAFGAPTPLISKATEPAWQAGRGKWHESGSEGSMACSGIHPLR